MPPEVPHYYAPLVTPIIQHPLAEAQQQVAASQKSTRGRMKMTFNVRKLIPVLVLILVCVSVIRLLRIVITTSTQKQACAYPPACRIVLENVTSNSSSLPSANDIKALTTKEFHFLSKLIKQKAPCNILIFGLEPQYLVLSSLNAGGTTIILEDDPIKIRTMTMNINSTQVYKVEYGTPANQAYALLKHARRSLACVPRYLQLSTCRLALKGLPHEVYDMKWDIVVVDGPSGNSPKAPGRMGTIYTASIVARAGNSTDVVVHDVDRTIEKWFSWEFLCEENLVSSKGKFWNFRVTGQSNSTRFCNHKTVQTQ